jgi:hypothetical protein
MFEDIEPSNYNKNNYNYNNRNNQYSGYNNQRNNNSNWKSNKKPIEEGKLYKPYVGTGNKETPDDVLKRMSVIAKTLEQFDFVLRTGGLEGPDAVFEDSVKNLELYIPWKGFNNKESKNYFNTTQSLDVAKMFHFGFDKLKPAIQAFLAKNVRMVLGKDLKSPAMFIVCWSEDGVEHVKDRTSSTGNIGHIIAIASSMKIPVFNLGKPDAEKRLKNYLELSENTYKQNEGVNNE